MKTYILLLSAALTCPAAVCAASAAQPETCTYEVFNWNIHKKRGVNMKRVQHPYSQLTAEEKDPGTGCTVCLEDQRLLKAGGLEPFLACNKIADKLQALLDNLLKDGEPVLEIVAYRPGRTKNPLDGSGNRTGFSNHAYGAAVDINRSKNGLYDRCQKFGPGCRLIQGGAWKAGARGALTRDSKITQAMRAAGFKWGGEIEGNQKDFMHFSPSGY
ncbi:MAG TPA: M15 family metallopeptidase [Elusimicrobiales bacterium]|nr:M15 family metallopeptidase [Elusimicrobiales bacterium]